MARLVRNLITQEAIMPKIYYPDNFKIEVVKHYKMHHSISATLEKYGIARSTLFKWKKKYEENHFFRVSKRPTNAGHKAQAFLKIIKKLQTAAIPQFQTWIVQIMVQLGVIEIIQRVLK